MKRARAAIACCAALAFGCATYSDKLIVCKGKAEVEALARQLLATMQPN